MTRPGKWAAVAAVVALALAGAACGDDDDESSGGGGDGGGAEAREGPTVSIGAQNFGESAILAEIYSQALVDDGFDTEVVELGGFRDILLDSFDNGDINLAPDYVASNLLFLDESAEATSDVDETLALLEPVLAERDLVALQPSEAVDTNAFVVTQETSEENDLQTLSDLANAGDLTLGAPQDCETNPFCIPGLQRVYDVDLSENFTPLEFDVIPDSLAEGAIDIGVLSSTNGRIADEGWVLLEDDQDMLAADNVFPLASQELVDAYGGESGELATRLDAVSAELTSDDLTALNERYDVENEDAEDIAADWLQEHDLAS